MVIFSPALLERFLGRLVPRFKQKPTEEISVVEAASDLDAIRALDGAYGSGRIAGGTGELLRSNGKVEGGKEVELDVPTAKVRSVV